MTSMFVRLSITLSALTGRLDARKDRGATAVEYGLLIGLIAVALITVIGLLGTDIAEMFGRMGARLDGVTPAAG